jgi:energy-coupling factor transporter transmembrane protein EcfT
MDRTERIYMAMLARGYDGTIRQRETLPVSGYAIAATGLALALFASVAVSARVLM